MADQDWQALARSSDALHVALVAWMAAGTPQAWLVVDGAAQWHTDGLAGPAAENYGRRLWAYRRAIERLHALRASMALTPSVNAEDAEFMKQLVADQTAAGRAFEAAGTEVVAVVEQARAYEKGGA